MPAISLDWVKLVLNLLDGMCEASTVSGGALDEAQPSLVGYRA
jgi:hypothetical protein